jgi:hypothetical protein
MSKINRWILTADTNGVDPTGYTTNIDAPVMLRKVSDLSARAAQGACASKLQLAFNPVAAQATVTATNTGTNGDTLTIAGIVITMKTSGANAANNEINIGGSVTALMNQVTGLVNGTTASSPNSWAGICTASNVAGVLTLTAYIPGNIGNGLALAKSSTSLTLTNAWGGSVVGTEGTSATYSLGIAR